MTKCTAQRCGDVDMSDKMCFTFFFIFWWWEGLHTVLSSWRIPTFTFKIKKHFKILWFPEDLCSANQWDDARHALGAALVSLIVLIGSYSFSFVCLAGCLVVFLGRGKGLVGWF